MKDEGAHARSLPAEEGEKKLLPGDVTPPTPSLRLIPASVPLRTPYSVLCRGSELQLGGPEEREREGERERRRERDRTDGRQCEQQRESCFMMKGDPLISSSRDSGQTEREGGHAPDPTPEAFTLSALPISRELLINTHASSVQPVTSSARMSVSKDVNRGFDFNTSIEIKWRGHLLFAILVLFKLLFCHCKNYGEIFSSCFTANQLSE